MSEPATGSGVQGTSRRTANLALVLIAVALVATTVLLLTGGALAAPGDSEAETLSQQYDAVTDAARAETLAFLTVDHQDMDPLIEKVLAGATGTFKEQYDRAQATLKSSAKESQAVSTGKVVAVGIGDIDDGRAVVLVAADSQVQNKSTQGEAQPRYYRLKLTMVRQGERWLTSNLQFVG